jgi:hypothetical protein
VISACEFPDLRLNEREHFRGSKWSNRGEPLSEYVFDGHYADECGEEQKRREQSEQKVEPELRCEPKAVILQHLGVGAAHNG